MANVTNYGSLLKKETGTPGAFTTIGEVVNIDFPELVNEAVETTNHGSGGYKSFIAGGLVEVGEFTVTMNYDKTQGEVMTTALVAGTASNYKIEFPNSGIWQFSALVTKFKPESADATSPEALQATVTFQPTGTCTIS